MSSGLSQWIDLSESLMLSHGVQAWAVTAVDTVDESDTALFTAWISCSHHAGMGYMERNSELRVDPALLLPGAKSVICCAIPYSVGSQHPFISSYALGQDYHDVVRGILSGVADEIMEKYGGESRVCVDSAPLRERYWALKSGLGMKGASGHVIVPAMGSACFLGEILTTLAIKPRRNTEVKVCERCGRCQKACPTGALKSDGTVDARKCLSYLTIEHRGDFPPELDLHSRLYGCDACTLACPHTSGRNEAVLMIPEQLLPRPVMAEITPQRVAEMTQSEFSVIFAGSPIKRTKFCGLQRNALHLLSRQNNE